MEIIDIVKFNDGAAIVVDEIPPLTYEKKGIHLIGSDESNLLFYCLYEDNFEYMKSFGGKEFDLTMKDGTEIHCNGQYWAGQIEKCSKLIGIKLCPVAIQTRENLMQRYAFKGYQINQVRYMRMLKDFLALHPGYEIWGYREYEGILNQKEPTQSDHPDKKYQKSFAGAIKKYWREKDKNDDGGGHE